MDDGTEMELVRAMSVSSTRVITGWVVGDEPNVLLELAKATREE